MKRIVGITYENGACVGITVDGILDNNTNPNELVNFERVRHGHWDAHHHRECGEYIQGHGYDVYEWDNYSCSYCGKQSPGNSKYNYCPYCGSKMSDVIGYATIECGYEDSEMKPCEIKAMDCEDCEYGLAIWREVIK